MATEQHLRQQLAAAYRLAALFGWEDTLYTHFSVRLPGDGEPRFLINPFGMMFDEVTASNLIVVDMQGKVVEGDAPANSAGFTIHSAVHMAREDAHCVIHTHTLPGMAVAACEIQMATAQLAALSPIHTIAPHLSQHACEQLMGVEHERQQVWQAWLRRLDRLDTSYKD